MTAGHKSFTLAADNDTDMQDWLNKLQSVLHQNKLQEDTRLASLERGKIQKKLNSEHSNFDDNYVQLQRKSLQRQLVQACLAH